MADNLDEELYPHNDDTIIVRPTLFRPNPNTGVDETITLTGRTDGVVFLSNTDDISTSVPIHTSLSVELTEIAESGTYAGVMEGSAKAAHLSSVADNTVLYRHFQFASDYRRVASVIFRKNRRG